jgi:hypothetical protein
VPHFFTIRISFIAGPLRALLFMVCSLWHFVHDTSWIGNGIAWFGPYSKKRYTYFPQEHKVKKDEHWIKAYYFHPTVVSVTETAIFIISLIILYLYTN